MLNYEILAVSHTLHLTPPPLPNTVLSTPLTRTRVGRFLIEIHQVTREQDYLKKFIQLFVLYFQSFRAATNKNLIRLFPSKLWHFIKLNFKLLSFI